MEVKTKSELFHGKSYNHMLLSVTDYIQILYNPCNKAVPESFRKDIKKHLVKIARHTSCEKGQLSPSKQKPRVWKNLQGNRFNE
jgi:hypothetical protein